MTPTVFMQHTAIVDLIDGLTEKLKTTMRARKLDDPVMIGIHTGGVWIAEQLHQRMHISEPLGTLNISFYRDDFSRIGLNPKVKPSDIPFDIEDRHIILVDDVLQTGRTIRAAMNELFDFGRPASITLATLITRSGRELPIEAAVSGLEPTLKADDYLCLTGPQPLELVLGKKTTSSRDS